MNKLALFIFILISMNIQGYDELHNLMYKADLLDRNIKSSLLHSQINNTKRIKLNSIPQTPQEPNYSGTFTQPPKESAKLTFWNQTIDNEIYLLVQLEPLSASFFFCPSGSQYKIIQNL